MGGLYKYSNRFPANTDVCDYPFILWFKIKDSARQQENGLLKMPRFSFIKKAPVLRLVLLI